MVRKRESPRVFDNYSKIDNPIKTCNSGMYEGRNGAVVREYIIMAEHEVPFGSLIGIQFPVILQTVHRNRK